MIRLPRSYLVALANGAVWACLAWAGGLDVAERLLYDARLRALHPPTALPDLVVVAIDDESLAFLGRWPWPRETQAQLLDGLREAKSVMWDVLLTDPGEAGADALLAESVQRQGRTLLAATVQVHTRSDEASDTAAEPATDTGRHLLPVPAMAAQAAGVGMAYFYPDSDGIVRSSEAVDADPARRAQLPMLHGLLAQRLRPGLVLPDHGRVFYNFQGTDGVVPHVSAQQVLTGEIPPAWFRGRHVLFGATSFGLHDRVTTPLGVTSGVVYHAEAATSLVRGDWREPPPPWSGPLAAGLVGFLAVLLWQSLSTTLAGGLSAAGLLALCLADLALFAWGRSWLPVATVLATSVGSALVLGLVHQAIMAAKLRRAIGRLMQAFEERRLYVAKENRFQEAHSRRLPIQAQVEVLTGIAEAFREEWHFLQALIDTNQNPVLVVDEQEQIMLSNSAGISLFGAGTDHATLRGLLQAHLDEDTLTLLDGALRGAMASREAPGPLLVQWQQQAYHVSFLKLTSGLGALCLFEDVTQLHRRANTDGLTGLWNRRYFDEQMALEVARSRRHPDHPVCYIISDVDHFKKVNDTYGHQIGDHVLILVADYVRRTVRATDVAGRYGGEEVVVLLPHTDLAGAALLAERLRQGIHALVPRDADGNPFTISASFGVAQCLPGEDAAGVMARADKALYESKEGGRNRVTLADAPKDAALA